MKTSYKLSFAIFIACPILLSPQSNTNFNIESYKQFLSSHQNMDAEQLLQMHDAGTFESNINIDYSSAEYFDSIDIKYNLTDYEKSLINKNGFMVSERLTKSSFGEALLDIYHKDLPLFITTDAILNAFHQSYDRILKDVELGVLIGRLNELLNKLHSALPQLKTKYASYPEMRQMLKDADVYLTVPRKLLDENSSPYFNDNIEKVNKLYAKSFEAKGIDYDTLFAEACVAVDWSQFKPRGHYLSDFYGEGKLQNYFRAMMWLGRIEIYLIPPQSLPEPECLQQNFQDAMRQIIDSYLLTELFDISDSWQLYYDFEKILRYFVGDQDNVTLSNLLYIKENLQINNADELLDSLKIVEFQDTLKIQSFAAQKILSQILISGNSTSPDGIVPSSAFMMFGQRFVIDSYVTGGVVFDKIFYNGNRICRLFPSTLDPMFALGNDAAGQLLKPELDQYHYSSNLDALRYLINSYGTEFWDNTIYNSWLNSVRKLNPPTDRTSLPRFMQTGAFWQQKLNTQLASWAQLRHDNLLYAKQSYTGGTICSYPYTYVEPFPKFYETLKDYALSAKNKFAELPFENEYIKPTITRYFDDFIPIMDNLQIISQKILDQIPFTVEEDSFMHNVIYDTYVGSGYPYMGWYPKLYYNDYFYDQMMKQDNLVADIHTTPTNCGGALIGAVTHVGTGNINLGVFVADLPETKNVAFVAPVMSYYEYVSTNFFRLTDQEWSNQYLQSAVRPSWVNIYLADSSGNSRGEGLQLTTSVEKDENNIIPQTYLTAQNYPNPFNPSTIISFSIPYSLTNSISELVNL